MRQRYPIYPSQIINGNLPSMAEMGPPDLRPSSSTASYYQRRLDSMYGRHLAGAAKAMGDDAEPAYALNELKLMAELDDTAGDGIFDPDGSRPNNYPDAGILASSYSFPGYLARERMYEPSEVVDQTTGRPVIYVNGGAVSMDSAAQIAFIEAGRYAPPRPVIDQYGEEPVPPESTVNIYQNPVPVTPASGFGQSNGLQAGSKLVLALALAGVGVGALLAFSKPKQKPNRRRRR